jgi:hypothetical protein
MSDWPKKMWMGKEGNVFQYGTETGWKNPVLVYPADQAPALSAVVVESGIAWVNGIRPPEGTHLYLAPPTESAIRASERERCAKVCDKFLAANTCAQVIRELGDE